MSENLTLKEVRHNEDGTMDMLMSNGTWYLDCRPDYAKFMRDMYKDMPGVTTKTMKVSLISEQDPKVIAECMGFGPVDIFVGGTKIGEVVGGIDFKPKESQTAGAKMKARVVKDFKAGFPVGTQSRCEKDDKGWDTLITGSVIDTGKGVLVPVQGHPPVSICAIRYAQPDDHHRLG